MQDNVLLLYGWDYAVINQYYISILAGMMFMMLSTLGFASKALTQMVCFIDFNRLRMYTCTMVITL